jgi:hypothetical protein
MKKHSFLFFVTFSAFFLLSGCYDQVIGKVEIRTQLCGTNIIGITGVASAEPYIEIQYSIADEVNPGKNKTASIMVSPPYIFQNNAVYMTYEYMELLDKGGLCDDDIGDYYRETLLHNYDEGGAEYLRIINHSPDKPVEFFIAGAQPEPINPSVFYRDTSVYFLLFPERNYTDNTLTEAWSVEAVMALYRAEYARSETVRLTVDYIHRMIDLVEGKVYGWESYRGNIFYGVIEAGEELRGNEKIWLLATPTPMFFDELGEGKL